MQIKDFMQDFDQLRSGLMTISQFRRCLSTLGFTSIGEHTLSDHQFEMLVVHFTDAKNPDKVRWADFMKAVETGTIEFTFLSFNITRLKNFRYIYFIC